MSRPPAGPPVLPLALVDVDGVLNAVTRRGDPSVWQDWRSGTASAGGSSWPITWSPRVAARVRGWHEAGLADVRWLTTWGDDANDELRLLLELPELPVAGRVDGPVAQAPTTTDAVGAPSSHAEHAGADARSALTGRWWKLDVVLALLDAEPDRPLLWIDDDLRDEPDAQRWLAENATCHLVAPRPDRGLTAPQLDAAQAWLEGFRTAG